MSRTQKKCLIASGALHMLLLAILVISPAFLIKKEEPVDQTVLTLVNTEVVDEPAVQAAPPQPTPPPAVPPKKADPPPKKPVEEKKPDPPKKEPAKEPDPVPQKKTQRKPDVRPDPAPKRQPPARKPIKLDLREHTEDTRAAQESARKLAEARERELLKVLEGSKIDVAIAKSNIKPMPRVSGGVSYDNYGSIVRDVYMRNWTPPNDIASKYSSVEVEIVIRKDGSVKSAQILKKSGSSVLDRNIATLINTRVKNIGKPFPDGAQEAERTYTIEFNLNLKFNGS